MLSPAVKQKCGALVKGGRYTGSAETRTQEEREPQQIPDIIVATAMVIVKGSYAWASPL
jgi:hypothetical protein